jgi:two-component system chemotaxis sensor kinase CheA
MTIDLAQFHSMFFEESFEALDAMEAALLGLVVGTPDADRINTIFRVAHSIKGGSAMFAFNEVTSFTHSLETLLDELRSERLSVTSEIADLLFKSVDVMRDLLRGLQNGTPHETQRVADLQSEIERTIKGLPPGSLATPATAPEIPIAAPVVPTPPETPVVETSLEAPAVETSPVAPVVPTPPDEVCVAIQVPASRSAETPPDASHHQGGQDSASIRVSTQKIDELMNIVGELVIVQAMLNEQALLTGPAGEPFRSGVAQLERNTRELQESVMRVRMLPISFVFGRFQRMARDLALRLGKQIDLKVTGENTEIDKTLLEKIGDPLTHLVRNSIDHGVELPDVRLQAGKPAMGTVHLNAYHRGGNIAVEVTDDGAGLDKDRILAKARSRGLVGPNQTLTDHEIHELIFAPGLSTAEKTTDVSGRGVGMDVVRRNVQELGGKVEIHSERGRGSRFTITLPLTLAIVEGLTARIGSETYIVPLGSIIESLQLSPASASRLPGREEVFPFRGDYLPVLRLHDLFGVEPRSRLLHEGLIVVAEGEGRRIGLFVDELVGQQQVVIKSLQTNYRRVPGVSGATILGDGSVALILDLPGIIRAASSRQAA